jgi:hypothetical protein
MHHKVAGTDYQALQKTNPQWLLTNSESIQSFHVKRGTVQSLHSTASPICQEQDLYEIYLRCDLQLNGSLTQFLAIPGEVVIHKLRSILVLFTLYVKGTSMMFKCTADH